MHGGLAKWAARVLCVGALVAWPFTSGARPVEPDAPKRCGECEAWNRDQEPFRVFGNTWYVGTAGLSAILIASGRDLVLIDGDLPQSAPLIAAHIVKLGYRIEDVKLILNSHTHFDHAGGIAALARASGAEVAASPASARALEQGGPTDDDPQFGFGAQSTGFPRVPHVRVVRDGETLHVGDLAVTARFTPGHTPGGTSWTWRSCEGGRCLDIVYADSLSAVSAPAFLYTMDVRHPDRVAQFRRSIDRVGKLRCDVLLSPHPDFFDMEGKLKLLRPGSGTNPFVDADACKAYAAEARRGLERREATERRATRMRHDR